MAQPAEPAGRAEPAGPAGTVDVLLVEDDPLLREATQLSLERYGYQVRTASDGRAGLARFRERAPDIAVFDVMLPHLDGVSLVRRIRLESRVPVLMVSARTDSVDVVHGLEAGADDYITKPYDIPVLVARIRSALRRATDLAGESPEETTLLRFGELTVDTATMEIRRSGQLLDLTPTERRLVLEFTAEPGVLLSRSALLERIWDYARGGDSRVVDTHVQRLRAKIGHDRIETVRGFGYRFKT
ncbi:two-component system response regulator CseB [Streptomyces gobiensis]|uniref:two-component system response regulator CseB n=1 Tax=Streptomyces gobiensis TaxID=2875706 RepID=UPI001E5FE242|nr:two-component system response regulator CseB [Streptomyces gobiensis]UGY91474.1 response regulator transcription factor [Streptomyces gobiensis]